MALEDLPVKLDIYVIDTSVYRRERTHIDMTSYLKSDPAATRWKRTSGGQPVRHFRHGGLRGCVTMVVRALTRLCRRRSSSEGSKDEVLSLCGSCISFFDLRLSFSAASFSSRFFCWGRKLAMRSLVSDTVASTVASRCSWSGCRVIWSTVSGCTSMSRQTAGQLRDRLWKVSVLWKKRQSHLQKVVCELESPGLSLEESPIFPPSPGKPNGRCVPQVDIRAQRHSFICWAWCSATSGIVSCLLQTWRSAYWFSDRWCLQATQSEGSYWYLFLIQREQSLHGWSTCLATGLFSYQFLWLHQDT